MKLNVGAQIFPEFDCYFNNTSKLIDSPSKL